MIVKICGITTVEAAKSAISAGADMLGFVFAKSSREISPDSAREIARRIRGKIKVVGVFVDEDIESIEVIAEHVGLDYIQLHGREKAETTKRFSLPVIKAFTVDENSDFRMISAYPSDYILLDGAKGKYQGGNGLKFDWDLTEKSGIDKSKLILAGGLTPENVGEAIERVKPYAIDVSSGVETSGVKDLDKIKCFISQAKKASQ